MLDEATLSRLIGRALQHGGEFADVFCERRKTLAYRLQDGRIHDATYGVTLGVGIRVVVGRVGRLCVLRRLEPGRPVGGRRGGVADRARRAGRRSPCRAAAWRERRLLLRRRAGGSQRRVALRCAARAGRRRSAPLRSARRCRQRASDRRSARSLDRHQRRPSRCRPPSARHPRNSSCGER